MKKYLCLLIITALMLTVSTGCKNKDNPELQPGDVLNGFTLNKIHDSSLYNSSIYTFHHNYSGADLVYVKNDDPEITFSIGYHTPYLDETDANHVFEHSILGGSEKYPSSNLYMELNSRAYLSFCNARTTYISTDYILASKSEDQLLKAMDAYLSCMISPDILKDKRYFQREAIRYELDDIDGDISINGTVFSEDYGYITDKSEQTMNAVLDALYPGEIASNGIGRAPFNYSELTYEHTIELYNRYYHFDNCLIFLYGNLDINRILEFLNSEYLSKYPAEGTDLNAFIDGPTEPGFVDVEVSIPAFKGDKIENNSTIAYAIDLSDKTELELSRYNILTDLFNQPESVFYNTAKEMGIENPISIAISIQTAKPFIIFNIANAEPEQKVIFKDAIETTLSKVAENGIDPAFLEANQKAIERNERLLLNNKNVGSNISIDFLIEWIHFGNPDIFLMEEETLELLREENVQEVIKGMAKALLSPERSALVTAVPNPGMAEELDRERAQFLSKMKASMSAAELQDMVRETEEFKKWNTKESPNNDIMISPEDLPDPEPFEFSKDTKNGILIYNGETSLKGIGKYSVYFDLSGMSREELMYLMLIRSCFFEMNTQSHTTNELSLLRREYLSDLLLEPVYPNSETGEYHRPMLRLSFTSLTEDFEKSLNLLTEVFTKTDFSDTDKLKYLTAVAEKSYDISRNMSGYVIASHGAFSNAGVTADGEKFIMDIDWQDTYYLIKEISHKLNEDSQYAAKLAAKYESVMRKAFSGDNLIFMSVTSKEDADTITESAVKILGELPKKEATDENYTLPPVPKSVAFGIEDSMCYTLMTGDCMSDSGFMGEYIPFVYALNDRYTIPTFRYELGVYSAFTSYAPYMGCIYTYLYMDPDVGKGIECLNAMSGILKDMEISPEQLDGYILKAYGDTMSSKGILNDIMLVMHYDLLGTDFERCYTVLRSIKNASIKDQQAAAEHIAKVLNNSSLCTAGNEALIRANEDCFDEVISLRNTE